jgi:DNA-binding LacI/PurR family transcriptional regulator
MINAPKYNLVAQEIKKNIENGLYPDRLPGIHDMAKQFNINFKTANKAISLLVENGVLERERGQCPNIVGNGKKKSKSVAVLMKADGDVYSKMAKALVEGLRKKNLNPTLFNLFMEQPDNSYIKEQLRKAKEIKADILIVEGDFNFPFNELKRIEREFKKIIIIHHAETDVPFQADYVLSDPWLGAYKATKHLLGLGHERILFFGPWWGKSDPVFFRRTDYCQIQLGYRLAMEEADLAKNERVFYRDASNLNPVTESLVESELTSLLTSKERPTAIFSFPDFRLKKIYDTVKKIGLKIPDDLALVGYYDTPWTEMFDPVLTSVSIKEESIAELAVKKALSTRYRNESVIVEPELVIRDSCGYKLKNF